MTLPSAKSRKPSPQKLVQVTPLLTGMTESPLSPHSPSSASFTIAVPHHSGWSLPVATEARSTEKGWADGKLPEMVSVVKETLREVSSTPVSIAVTGDSGNGMSSFINVLRGIGQEEEDSAPTGVVRTTLTRASYSSSHFPYVVLWDMPGTGATSQSLKDYLLEMQFSQYDLFIIIASEQFSMNHVRLAKAVEDMGKKFYVVWTKLDRDLSMSAFREGQLHQSIRRNILENLQKEQVHEPSIFLVSNLDPLLHDFPKLKNTLQQDLFHIRCDGPLQNLFHSCEESINDKVTFLKDKIGTQSFPDALGISNADDLEECLKAYHRHFGVDDESLQLVAQTTGKACVEYKFNMKSQDLQAVNNGNWKLIFMNCTVVKAFLNFLRWIPFLGILVHHYFIRMKQKHFLAIVAEDTKSILRKVQQLFLIPDEH